MQKISAYKVNLGHGGDQVGKMSISLHTHHPSQDFIATIFEPGLPRWLSGKESVSSAGDADSILGQGDPPEQEMVTHSSILAWRIPQTKELGGLQSIRSQRVGHDLVTEHRFTYSIQTFKKVLSSFTKIIQQNLEL